MLVYYTTELPKYRTPTTQARATDVAKVVEQKTFTTSQQPFKKVIIPPMKPFRIIDLAPSHSTKQFQPTFANLNLLLLQLHLSKKTF